MPKPIKPKNWKAAAPYPPSGSLTYGQQSTLPRLPVPKLSDTLSKLKTSLKPIAHSEEEYQKVIKKIEGFEAGLGPELQKRLEARAQEPGREHWLEEWWDDLAYMGYRESVVINVSYYYGFTPQPSHLPQTPVARAAALTRSTLLFRQKLLTGQVPPDATREGPLCMDTWRWMFDACRIPERPSDWAISYAKEGDNGISGHVIALRKGRVWKIPAVTPDGSRLLSTSELERHFQHIYDNTTDSEYPNVGVLTANDRDTWADDFKTLCEDPNNAEIVKEIHSSAFVMCLDTECPEGPIEHSRALWHGGVTGGELNNRWNDKPVQLIVFDNAKAGIMGEHSVMDGTPTTRMCDEVLDAIADKNFDYGPLANDSNPLPPPQPLDWTAHWDLNDSIAKAEVAASELVNSQELGFHLTSYGKAAIKKFGVSPDSWTQMIIQLAYHRLRGGQPLNGGTYEAATTRRFLKGRTEAIRIVTEESRKWVASMDDPSVGDADRKALFDAAAKKHIADAKLAGKAQGIDRHLIGLRLLVGKEESVPEMYDDQVYTRAKNWVLSTSAIFSKHFPVYGWGEVVPDGFGVAYMTGYDDRLQFTVTSRKEMPNAEFVKEIAKAAEDIKALFESISKPKL